MNETDAQGLCPSCDAAGPIGQACGEKVCAKRGYRFVPEVYHAKIAAASAGTQDPVVGQLIGDYLVVDILGAGGFGTVYMALQQPIQLRAALKLMNLRADPTLAEIMIEKFRAEAAALASLSHPNVVRLLKYGRFGDMPYLVMEFVEGARTLKDEIAARAVAGGTLHINDSAKIVTQCLNALEAAHERAIVHRDVKPDNIMLQKVSGDPHFVRVLDFGLAKFVDQRTLTSTTVGTPVYMAPEQLTKGRIGPWTDLYALGIVAFEMLTGLSPFPGESQQAILTKKVDPSYSPTSRLTERDMPAYMVRFFEKAIARDPQERFQNAAEFRAEFSELHAAMGGDSGISTMTDVREIVDEVAVMRAKRSMMAPSALASAPTGLSTGPAWVHDQTLAQAPSPASSATSQPTQSQLPAKKRSPWPFVGVGVLVAAAATVALVMATGGQGSDPEQLPKGSGDSVSASVAGETKSSVGANSGPTVNVKPKVVVATAAPTLAPADAQAMQFQTLLLVAEEHLNKRRWQDAMTAYGEARVRQPDNASAKAGFAKASAEKSRMLAVKKAAEAIEKGDFTGASEALASAGDLTASAYAKDAGVLAGQAEELRAAQAAKELAAKAGVTVPGTAPKKVNGTPKSASSQGGSPAKGTTNDSPVSKPADVAPGNAAAFSSPSPKAVSKPASTAKPKSVAAKPTKVKKPTKKPTAKKPTAEKPATKAAAKTTPKVTPQPKTKPGTHVKVDKLDRASARMKGRLKKLTGCKSPKVRCPAIRNACVSVGTCSRMTRLRKKKP